MAPSQGSRRYPTKKKEKEDNTESPIGFTQDGEFRGRTTKRRWGAKKAVTVINEVKY